MKRQCHVTRALSVLVGVAFVVVAGSPANGTMVRDLGRKGAYASAATASLTGGATTLVTVTIQKGKKKHVLEVDGAVNETTNTATNLAIAVRVNGLYLMEPTPIFQTEEGCSNAAIGCTAHGTWWLDLDQAELANPGLFIGVPLVIELQGAATGTSPSGIGSVRARLFK